MSDANATVFVVDDERSMRRAICRLLALEEIHAAEFASPEEFLATQLPDGPACLVLDMAMPGLTGLELQQRLITRGRAIPIIFLTGRADVPMTVQAMKLGAHDFLTKPVETKKLIATVRAALAADRRNRTSRAEVDEIQLRVGTLTPREREVFIHVVTGKLNKQIAGDLGTAEKTIKVHRARVMEKMRARSFAELIHLAEKAGLPKVS
jgi:FixJ family two-component response regulator